MRKTQTKNTTQRIVLSLIFLVLGETIFSAGLYWPVLFSLFFVKGSPYWYGLVFGILISLLTSTPLGLASVIIVVGMFVFSLIKTVAASNVLMLSLSAVVFGLLTDLFLSLSWGWLELTGSVILVWILWRLNYFDDDLALRGAR